ncbi:stage II sporulation protein D [Planifilum fimeticola]|uniref:Stage II sporulation protein D n=1 Tax=Planifilum fimeticola TaxID=201975 RepID=A0A2T0LI72_9BACL|nr:stage II sporulation protein D [Planifilum fimeticola]PRX42002.1 stage II sporulation protein D [Planifilum fimeticola]
MRKGLWLFVPIFFFLLVMLAVPALLVSYPSATPQEKAPAPQELPRDPDEPVIRVFLSEEKRVVRVPLEQYVRGVVAAEMPADFHMEALKAQALAARTYIVDRLRGGDFSDMETMGTEAKGAHVSDSVLHQAYRTDEQLKKSWGDRYAAYSSRINRAVLDTRGQVILYEGEPIYAAFFSTSNGRTENSEDVFSKSFPYLRSVPSPWDEKSPRFLNEKTLTLDDFVRRMEKATGKRVAVAASSGGDWIRVLERTSGRRIKTLRIGDQTFTGRQVREALGLSSTDFTWTIENGRIRFQSKGYGHGVGMSQWGANLLAHQGKSAEEIVRHYYRGVDIGSLNAVLSQASKKN